MDLPINSMVIFHSYVNVCQRVELNIMEDLQWDQWVCKLLANWDVRPSATELIHLHPHCIPCWMVKSHYIYKSLCFVAHIHKAADDYGVSRACPTSTGCPFVVSLMQQDWANQWPRRTNHWMGKSLDETIVDFQWNKGVPRVPAKKKRKNQSKHQKNT